MFSSIRILLILAVRNVARNPRRSIITLAAIVVGLWSTLTLASLAQGMARGIQKDAIRNLTGHIQIHAPGFLDDPVVDLSMAPPSEKVTEILKGPEIAGFAPRIRVPVVIQSERESRGVTLIGIDPETERGLSFIPDAISNGSYLEHRASEGIILGERLIELLQTEPGKRIVVMGQDANGDIADRAFRITGIYDAELESTETAYAFVSLKAAQELFLLGNSLSEISILLLNEGDISEVVKRLREADPELDVQPWNILEPFIEALINVQGKFLVFWFVIVIIAISLGLINTLFMAILERIHEIGLVQALGMTRQLVVMQILLESTVLLTIGVILGNLLSLLSVVLLRNGLDLSNFAAGTAHFGGSSIIYPEIILDDWLTANVLIFIIGLISSLYPAWRASRYLPAEALKAT